MGYKIGSEFVEDLLGKSYYFVFVAPTQSNHAGGLAQPPPYVAIFSLSPNTRVVSRVDETSSFHFYHLDQFSGPVIRFEIGDVLYQWNTQHNTLYKQVKAEFGVLELGSSAVPLYTDLTEAKISVDFLQEDNRFEALCESMRTTTIKSTDSVEYSSALSVVLPSSTIDSTSDSLCDTRLFTQFPSGEDIDEWANHGVMTNRTVRNGAKVNCPVPGCDHSSRCPHALTPCLHTHHHLINHGRLSDSNV